MEKKTLKQFLNEKKAQEQPKEMKVNSDIVTGEKMADWDTIFLLGIMLSIFSSDSPRVRALELEIAELKGKISIFEKLV